MNFSASSRYAIGICTASLIFAGCGGSPAQVGVPATAQQSAGASGHPDRAALRHLTSGTGTKFTVSGRFIYLNGKKFFVKGMAYAPTPIGTYPWDAPAKNSPLRDGNSAIWERDLPKMRAMGVNAIRIYNVVPPKFDKDTGPISNFLDAAWNNGRDPIYVLLTIHFDASCLSAKPEHKGCAQALASQYYDMDEKYAGFPAVMGVVISNEIFKPEYLNDGAWWAKFNLVAENAKKGFAAGKNPDKIVTTSNEDATTDDGDLPAIYYGEIHHAQVDVWGDNPYRGRTFTNLYGQIRKDTQKPVLLTEYGTPAPYHPDWPNTYHYPHDLRGVGTCKPTDPNGPKNRNAVLLPTSGNPGMDGLVDLVTNNAKIIHRGYTEDGVLSGGFYFEWPDDWGKADANNPEFTSKPVGDPVFTGHFPGCAYDHAWFGLNGISLGGKKYVDVLTARPTIEALKAVWATQK